MSVCPSVNTLTAEPFDQRSILGARLCRVQQRAKKGNHQSMEFVCVSNSHADAFDRLLIGGSANRGLHEICKMFDSCIFIKKTRPDGRIPFRKVYTFWQINDCHFSIFHSIFHIWWFTIIRKVCHQLI